MESGIGPEALRLLRGIAAAAAQYQGLADISHAGAELGLSAAQVDALQAPHYAQGLIQTDRTGGRVFLTALGHFRLEPEERAAPPAGRRAGPRLRHE